MATDKEILIQLLADNHLEEKEIKQAKQLLQVLQTNLNQRQNINREIHSKRYINMDDLEIDETLEQELLSNNDLRCLLNYYENTQEIQIHVGDLEEYINNSHDDFLHDQLPDLIDFLNQEKIDYITY